jgi:ElaB/YqjD/DUF883 family membrane-anchored ribosome-binding protein
MAAGTYDDEIKALKDDLAGLRKDMQTLVKTVGEDARNRGRETVSKAKAEAGRYADEAVTRGKEGMAAIESHIEDRPFTSVLMAFGIGLVIGKLLDR